MYTYVLKNMYITKQFVYYLHTVLMFIFIWLYILKQIKTVLCCNDHSSNGSSTDIAMLISPLSVTSLSLFLPGLPHTYIIYAHTHT